MQIGRTLRPHEATDLALVLDDYSVLSAMEEYVKAKGGTFTYPTPPMISVERYLMLLECGAYVEMTPLVASTLLRSNRERKSLMQQFLPTERQ